MAGFSDPAPLRASDSQQSSWSAQEASAHATRIASAPVFDSFWYLREQLTHRKAKFANLDEHYIIGEKTATAHEARLFAWRALLDTNERELTILWAMSSTFVSELDTAQQFITALTSRAADSEASVQVPSAPLSELANNIFERYLWRASVWSVLAQFCAF